MDSHLLLGFLIVIVEVCSGQRPLANTHTWSGWSQWSSCSMTCGRATRMRYRECVGVVEGRVHRVQSPTCAGNPREWQLCQIRDCPDDALPLRVWQCASKNPERIYGDTYDWSPFFGGRNPCELKCLAQGFSFYYNFGHVTDGTPCYKDNMDDICVNGHCARVGCDKGIDSGLELDKCLVCGGLNHNCSHFNHVYFNPMPTAGQYGYHEIVRIPAGATFLKVEESSKNFLAVADVKKAYIINGNWVIDWPGRYQVAGTIINYTRQGEREIITAEGPTQEDLFIMLMFMTKNPGVTYAFYIPTNKRSLVKLPTIGRNSYSPIILPEHMRSGDDPTLHGLSGYKATVYDRRQSKSSADRLQDQPPRQQQQDQKQTTTRRVPVIATPSKRPKIVNINPDDPSKVAPLESGSFETILNAKSSESKRTTLEEGSERLNKSLDSKDSPFFVATLNGKSMSYVGISAGDIDKLKRMHRSEMPVEAQEANRSGARSKSDTKTTHLSRGDQGRKKHSSHEPQLRDGELRPRKKRRRSRGRSRLRKDPGCPPCGKVKNIRRHYCKSGLVFRAKVTSFNFVNDSTRYELLVESTFRSEVPLVSREFVWVPNRCLCPRMRIEREYVIMGNMGVSRYGETIIVVSESNYVRRYSTKTNNTLLKLEEKNKCKKRTKIQ